jgi:hypothetical protein
MTGKSSHDPLAAHPERTPDAPRPIVPVPATMVGALRGRRVLVGLPGHGWRPDLRADERVVQGSRTYVPVMQEAEWYRAEAEQTEVFAPLIPIERVWVEDYGIAGSTPEQETLRLVSLDEPTRQDPAPSINAGSLTGRRAVQVLGNGKEFRDLRAVTELYISNDGSICARITTEIDWYRWGWTGRTPSTLEVTARHLWIE